MSTVALTNCMDIDSHEMIPIHLWPDYYGHAADLVPRSSKALADRAENSIFRDDLTGDLTPITDESVWNVKGPGAPGAIDLERRLEVLDLMGISRQLVFPGFGLVGVAMALHPDVHLLFDYDPSLVDRERASVEIIAAHNSWALRMSAIGSGRVRPVGIVMTETLVGMMDTAGRLIDDGIRAIWVPAGLPPAGLSPADRQLDPFWKLIEDANIAVVNHIGTEFAFLRSHAWSANVPEFVPSHASSVEFPVEPYHASVMHLASENFLCAMVLGGVFERHPNLRYGVIECGSHWIAPLAERLDIWYRQFNSRLSASLSMRPSEYLVRNVRVTPHYFEPVAKYIDRYPDLAEVYCFSTDYPHREGGKETKKTFYDEVASLGDDCLTKFFVTNGELLLPE